MSRNAVLTINLKPHLADYCRHEMKQDVDGNIILSRKSDLGKVISSMVLTSDLPVSAVKCDNPVSFVVPVTAANQYAVKYHFIYVSKWGEQRIQDYIEAEFNQRMRILFECGYRKNYTQKQIVEAILEGYNIKKTALSYEAVKKSDYRTAKKIRKLIINDIQSFVL